MAFHGVMSWIWNERQDDRYQDHFILGSSFLGVAIGMLTGFDLQSVTLSILPGVTLAATLLSIAVHELFTSPKLGSNSVPDSANNMDEKSKVMRRAGLPNRPQYNGEKD